ncbi:MAG: hypothetical protein JXA43_01900 [Candidatus Diapherotrites archaeon]|nr:hypothetical protein [Candidatus Diapherotrites archaeon]
MVNYSVLLHAKPAKTLLCLRDGGKTWYASMLTKEVDCTYPHMIKILNDFQDIGIVITEKRGRTKIIKLTDAGEDLARDLEGLMKRLEKL